MFTDTHCHINAPELRARLPEILAEAKARGINGLIAPSASAADWPHLLTLAQRLPEIRAVALGVHPWFVNRHTAADLADLDTQLSLYPAAWVGEIGLDFHANRLTEQPKAAQIALFEAQLRLAQYHVRPIILHNVKATQAIVSGIRRVGLTYGGIAHAFSGSLEEAEQLIRLGFKIGLGSLLLNPRARKVQQLAQKLPENSILLETDSPYMLPKQQNTPANVAQIAQIVAQLRGISIHRLAQSCEKNLQDLLGSILQRG